MDIYVSKEIKEGCFSTVYAAQQAVRDIICNGISEPITVHIENGRHFFNEPIVFTAADSGTADCTVTYQGGGKTEITGSFLLEHCHFEVYAENTQIFWTKLAPNLHIDGLLINGRPQVLARYPNFVAGTVPLGSVANEADIKVRAAGYKDPTGGYVRALHSNRWGGNSYIITQKDPYSPLGLALKWVGDNNRGSKYDAEALVVENVFEELDAPNEWYYDNDSGLLYVYPDAQTDLNAGIVEAVVNSELFRFCGVAQAPVHNISLKNLTLRDTKRTMFTIDEPEKQYVPLLRGDWAVVRRGAITLENAENITLSSSEYLRIGGNGIFVSGYSKDICIEKNKFLDTGASCIQIAGLPEAVYDPSFWEHDHFVDNPKYPIHLTSIANPDKSGSKSDDYPRSICISQNEMCGIGLFEKQSGGVNLSVCSAVRILHNTIHDSARSCININDGCFGGHEIAWNDIFDSQRETTDHGPFNSWGRDRFWSVPEYNAWGFHGDVIRPYALLDVINTIEIHNNRFHHSASADHTWGIDLDDGSSNYNIHHNLCLGMGIKLREGFDRHVWNNLIIDGQMQIHCTYKQARDNIHSNIFLHPMPWAFAGQIGGEKNRIEAGEYQVDYNGYFYFDTPITLPHFWQDLGLDTHAVVGIAPHFKDIDNGDYSVTNADFCKKIGFENFPMDQFGCANSTAAAPVYRTFVHHDSKTSLKR